MEFWALSYSNSESLSGGSTDRICISISFPADVDASSHGPHRTCMELFSQL